MTRITVEIDRYADAIRKGDDPSAVLAIALAQQRLVDAEIANEEGLLAHGPGTYARGQWVMASRIIRAIHGQACGNDRQEES
jgi:hypothetical protein